MMSIFGQRFGEALLWTHELHAGQTRKASGVPYISHLLAVVSLVIESGGNENEAIAALLHDAAEDCGGLSTLEQIRLRFGSEVAEVVRGCSDSLEQPKPPWQPRKQSHLRSLETALPSIQLVSAADKLHNMRSTLTEFTLLGARFWDYFRGNRDGMLWYYAESVRIFRNSSVPRGLVLELTRTWDFLVRHLEQVDSQ